MLANWPTATRIKLNWGLVDSMHETGAERGEVRHVRLASRTAADLRRRYVHESEGQFEIPRELPCDRFFAENINEVFFLAACHEYVTFASELPAADANVAQMTKVIRECQLVSGPFEFNDHGERTDNRGSCQRHRFELLIMKRLDRVVPWREFELIRHSKTRILQLNDQQGCLFSRQGELCSGWAAFDQPVVRIRGDDDLP